MRETYEPHKANSSAHIGSSRLRTWRSAVPLAIAGLLTAVATTGCSVSTEPDGVELGKDWKGAGAFVLSKVGGQLTVVGVNSRKGTAEPLAIIPSQADDNGTLAPQIVQLADGQRVISVPRKDGKPDRLYKLDREEHALNAQSAGVEAVHGLYPAKSWVAAVPGLAEEGKAGSKGKGGGSAVLVEKSGSWATARTAKVPGTTISLAASEPGSDELCLTQDADNRGGRTRVSTVSLADGKVHDGPAAPEGFEVQQLACDDGHPVLAGPGKPTAGKTSSGSSKADEERKNGNTVLTVDGGRVDQLAVHGGEIVAAVFHKDQESLVTLDAKSGKETHRVTLPGLNDAEGIQHTDQGWLLFSDDGAALVGPSSRKAKKVDMPGTLLAS